MQRGMLLKGTEGEHRDEERFQITPYIEFEPYVI